MREYLQVVTTVQKEEDARSLARHLVEAKLAGCVQILGPLRSIYRWEGEVEEAEEWLCLIKTAADLYPELERAIGDVHPYEVPEILAFPVAGGSEAYLRWLEGCLRRA